MTRLEGVTTTPAVRERFSPEEISEAYSDYLSEGPSLVDEETGRGVTVYEVAPGRILFVFEGGNVNTISTVEDFGPSRKPYPPPPRDNTGSALALVYVIA